MKIRGEKCDEDAGREGVRGNFGGEFTVVHTVITCSFEIVSRIIFGKFLAPLNLPEGEKPRGMLTILEQVTK